MSLGSPSPSVASAHGARVHPAENDIILGRGVLNAGHPGNVRFYKIIDQYIHVYDGASTRKEKTKIIQTVYDILTSLGRFVKDDAASAACVVVEASVAKKKISHAIRFRRGCTSGGSSAGSGSKRSRAASPRRARRKKQKQQQSKNSTIQREEDQDRAEQHSETIPSQESPLRLFTDEELESVLLPPEVMASVSMNFEDFL